MKVVRIMSILAAIIAVVLVMLPTVLASASAKDTPKVSATGNILERFQKARSERPSSDKEEISALVKEAKGFALYLNPPPKEPPPKPTASRQSGIAEMSYTPISSTGKFKLIATCVNQSRPELSLALIDLPGEGIKWIRQGGKIDYLVIKEIKDGLIVVGDSQRTLNVLIEPRPPQVSLVKGKSLTQMQTTPSTAYPAAVSNENRATSAVSSGISGQDSLPVTEAAQQETTLEDAETSSLTADEEVFFQKFMNELDAILANTETDDEASIEESFKKADELYQKYLSEREKAKAEGEQTAAPTEVSKKQDVPKPAASDPNLSRRQPPRRRVVPPK